MSHGALWDRFVADGVAISRELEQGVTRLVRGELEGDDLRAHLAAHALDCFQVGYQALLLGAEEIGKLAIACEQACDVIAAGAMPADGIPILASSAATLARAFHQLANPDKSGARTEGLPLAAATYDLETLLPAPGKAGPAAPDVPVTSLRRRSSETTPPPIEAAPEAAPATAATAPEPAVDADADTGAGEVWKPTVDADMIDLFFEEARERLEELAVKLLDIEQRPGDVELLRDIFRDLHTVKGSSAMVGLQPANKLAHAAEDLVGQLREGDRAADGPVVDALLAALDGLREVIRQAQLGVPITVDFGPIVKRLRDPNAAPAPVARPASAAAAPEVSEATAADTRRRPDRQTIRVDFDKLDKLMNLVGELVLGRDGLKHALSSLSAVAGELSGDRQLTRQIVNARRAVVGGGSVAGARATLADLGDELGRVERVLVDINADLDYATGRLDSVSDDLRDQVMKLRMVPIGGVFRKHHRTVRDLSASLGKRCKLVLGGEDTELDKLLVETLDEPLMHLVRNAVDHGIEAPDVREKAGKPAEGTIHLSASHRGNQMVIQIADDGKGLDRAALAARALEREVMTREELDGADDKTIYDVIFRPGFSTAQVVSEVSGRGVGMDVVKQTIVTKLKGTIDIDSELGAGSTFTLRLPLTLAIIQVLLARTGGEVYALPLDTVVRTFACPADRVQLIQDREVVPVAGRQIPLIRLAHVLELDVDPFGVDELQVILVGVGDEIYGLACEHLLGKKEIVIKSLGDLLGNVPCAAGATLLGDRCAIILDVPGIVDRALHRTAPPPPPNQRAAGDDEVVIADDAPHVLLVEDSDTVRETLRRLLHQAGYRVTVAVDGLDGLEKAHRHQYDLVSTDVMMPRMDGYELTRTLRATPNYRDVPIVMVTSRGERIDRVRGFDAGVDEYITKPHDRALLLRVVRQLLGDGGNG